MACDSCGKNRRSHRTVSGRQWDGADVDLDTCFLCCAEEKRGRVFDRAADRYVRPEPLTAADLASPADDQITF